MSWIVRLLDRLTEFIAIAVTLALLTVVMLGIVFRLANDPLVWTDELARYLMVWLALLGWVVAARRRAHIRITVLVERLPRRLRVPAEVATQLAVLVFGSTLSWHSFELIERAWDVEAVSLPMPSALLYLLVPVAGLAVCAQSVVEIVRVLHRGQSIPQPEAQALT
jgi:TRAP-type transport system small permease protein